MNPREFWLSKVSFIFLLIFRNINMLKTFLMHKYRNTWLQNVQWHKCSHKGCYHHQSEVFQRQPTSTVYPRNLFQLKVGGASTRSCLLVLCSVLSFIPYFYRGDSIRVSCSWALPSFRSHKKAGWAQRRTIRALISFHAHLMRQCLLCLPEQAWPLHSPSHEHTLSSHPHLRICPYSNYSLDHLKLLSGHSLVTMSLLFYSLYS